MFMLFKKLLIKKSIIVIAVKLIETSIEIELNVVTAKPLVIAIYISNTRVSARRNSNSNGDDISGFKINLSSNNIIDSNAFQ